MTALSVFPNLQKIELTLQVADSIEIGAQKEYDAGWNDTFLNMARTSLPNLQNFAIQYFIKSQRCGYYSGHSIRVRLQWRIFRDPTKLKDVDVPMVRLIRETKPSRQGCVCRYERDRRMWNPF